MSYIIIIQTTMSVGALLVNQLCCYWNVWFLHIQLDSIMVYQLVWDNLSRLDTDPRSWDALGVMWYCGQLGCEGIPPPPPVSPGTWPLQLLTWFRDLEGERPWRQYSLNLRSRGKPSCGGHRWLSLDALLQYISLLRTGKKSNTDVLSDPARHPACQHPLPVRHWNSFPSPEKLLDFLGST